MIRYDPTTYLLLGSFLLVGHSLFATLAGASVVLRALSADGQAGTVTDASVAADIHQTLDVHLNFTAQLTFGLVLLGDDVTDDLLLVVGPVLHFLAGFNASLVQDFLRQRPANAVNVG